MVGGRPIRRKEPAMPDRLPFLSRRHALTLAVLAFGATAVAAQAFARKTSMITARTCITTAALPSGWGAARGFALAGDAAGLAPGKLRLHVVTHAEMLEPDGAALPDDRSGVLAVQARALLKLRGLSAVAGQVGDMTAQAATRGVAPKVFIGPDDGGKLTQPTRILALPQTGGMAWFTALIPIDAPQAALTGTLHGVWPDADFGLTYAQTILGGIAPAQLMQIMAEGFMLMVKETRACK